MKDFFEKIQEISARGLERAEKGILAAEKGNRCLDSGGYPMYFHYGFFLGHRGRGAAESYWAI